LRLAERQIEKYYRNRFWEPPASIWHQFGAARSNLGGFWLVWARFVVELGSILAVFLNGLSAAFAKDRFMNNMH